MAIILANQLETEGYCCSKVPVPVCSCRQFGLGRLQENSPLPYK